MVLVGSLKRHGEWSVDGNRALINLRHRLLAVAVSRHVAGIDVRRARVASLPALDVRAVCVELKADFGREAELPDIGVNAARGTPGPVPRDRDIAVPVLDAQELVYPPL